MNTGQEAHGHTSRRLRMQPDAFWPSGYYVAVLLVGATLLFRFTLRPWFGLNVPYLQFFPAI